MTCLEVDANRAWIGATVVARGTRLDLAGFEVVQFLIDNGDGTVECSGRASASQLAVSPVLSWLPFSRSPTGTSRSWAAGKARVVASPERPNSVRGFGCLGQIARASRRGSTATVAVLTTARGSGE